jgi:Zn-dependent M28 family amino/carboxypeptidase
LKRFVLIAACLLVLAGCKHKPQQPAATGIDYTQVAIPAFNADSAYSYVEAQLSFGNRTPGSKGWEQCAAWLEQQLQRHCDTVIVQPFKATLWDGTTVPGRNIVGSLNPMAQKRVMLAAHWDSRLWADHDPDDANHRSPVPGANDGASGAAVLLEMARVMSQMPPSVGVDFVLFDVEDQGQPEWADTYEDNTWCKGSQHWAQNRHIPYYTAVYGVLFDMVGTAQPRFTKEQVSRHYAPGLTDKLWNTAAALGYSNIFVNQSTDPILDDHLYVNQIAGIPMADIVQNSGTTSFFIHWHTTTDDLSNLNAESLRIVATVTMKTIYGDYPNGR